MSSTNKLSPSPISPTGPDSEVWNIFGGTVRQVFEDTESLKWKIVVPVGDIMTGKLVKSLRYGLDANIGFRKY